MDADTAAELSWPTGLVTFLFTDIVDSTSLNVALGNNRAYPDTVLKPFQTLTQNAVREHGGKILQFTGDGFLLVFQDAQKAVACAKTLQQNFGTGRTVTIEHVERPLAFRVGIHTAERSMTPDVMNEKGDVIGYTPLGDINFARRVLDSANGGQILLSQKTYDAIATIAVPGSELREWPNRFLKGYDLSAQSLWEWQYDGKERGEPGKRWLSPTLYAREMNRFIGREEKLAAIVAWLKADKKPLLVLEGFGGNGKTRLAVEAVLRIGGAFDGCVVFLPLDESFSGPSENATRRALSEVFARAIDGSSNLAQAIQQASTDTDAEKLLHDFINQQLKSKDGDLRLLLVLDNWESVANAQTHAWADALLRNIPRLRCLATTRTAFGVPALLQTLSVDGLPVPEIGETDITGYDSYQLFVERAQQRDPDASFSDTASLIRILRAVEGSPLGIELTAAQAIDYSLREIADGLEKSVLEWQQTRTDLGDIHSGAARHESMWACIDWSVKLLPEAERDLFVRLSLFPFDFGVETAAEAIDGTETQLLKWKRANLLRRADTSDGGVRYTLPPPVRDYAGQALADDARAVAEELFVNYWSDWIIDNNYQERDDNGDIQSDFSKLLAMDIEWRTVVEAQQMALARRMRDALDILTNIANYLLDIRARWEEAEKMLNTSLIVAQIMEWEPEKAAWKHCLASVYYRQRKGEKAIENYWDSIKIRRTLGDKKGEINSLQGLANALGLVGDLPGAELAYEDNIVIQQEMGYKDGEAVSLIGLGIVLRRQGREKEAVEKYEKARTISSNIDIEAISWHNEGFIHAKQKRLVEAEQCFIKSVLIRRSLQNPYNLGLSLSMLGQVQAGLRKRDAGIKSLKEAIMLLEKTEDTTTLQAARNILMKLQATK